MNSGRVAHRCLPGGYILGGRGRFWEGHINMIKRIGVYYGREGVDTGRVAYI